MDSDGQIEGIDDFDVGENGVRVSRPAIVYEYGDDDLLDRTINLAVDEYYGVTEYDYELEADRVRVEWKSEFELNSAEVFDDAGRVAFRWYYHEGDHVGAYVDGIPFGNPWAPNFTRHPLASPDRLFPYEPLDLTEADIDDFSYDLAVDSTPLTLARSVSFSDAGLLEHLTLSLSVQTIDIDVLRCGGVVLEDIDFLHESNLRIKDEVLVYYYGCDDFVLPPLPRL
jgi:hypothetical protein